MAHNFQGVIGIRSCRYRRACAIAAGHPRSQHASCDSTAPFDGIKESVDNDARDASPVLSSPPAAHHGEPAAGGMHHGVTGTVVELCLGAFTAVGVAVAAIAIALRSFGRWIGPRSLLPTGVAIVRRLLTLEPRAGRPPQSLLCIWRL